MYTDTLSGSTVKILNNFMQNRDEDYLLIKDLFIVFDNEKKYYFSLVLGKLLSGLELESLPYSHITMSDLKKAKGQLINIPGTDEVLNKLICPNAFSLANISLPVYALMKKCLCLLQQNSKMSGEIEKLIRFEQPININAQCENRGGYSVTQYYGETASFPLIGIVPFASRFAPYDCDYNKIKV